MHPISCLLSLTLLSGVAVAQDHDRKITLDQAPTKVQTAIAEHAKGDAVESIELESRDGKTVYSVEYAGTEERELAFSGDGELLPDDDADEAKAAPAKAAVAKPAR